MIIPKARHLGRVLGIYKPEWRYLKEAALTSPTSMEGLFEIPNSGYVEDTGHFNAVELFVCYNQLAYAFLDEASLRGYIDEPNSTQLNIEEIKRMQLEKCLIGSADNIKFRNIINPRKFSGVISIDRVKKSCSKTIYRTSYDFENGSATGRITLVKLR